METENLNKKLTSFSAHLYDQYGKQGTAEKEQYEEEFEAFKLGVIIQELPERKVWRKNSSRQMWYHKNLHFTHLEQRQ